MTRIHNHAHRVGAAWHRIVGGMLLIDTKEIIDCQVRRRTCTECYQYRTVALEVLLPGIEPGSHADLPRMEGRNDNHYTTRVTCHSEHAMRIYYQGKMVVEHVAYVSYCKKRWPPNDITRGYVVEALLILPKPLM